ncbi:hypothetical protein [Pseudomonas sp. NBRC 111132]|uniref:hypothetical protein n=1 Tax=Pseudomonas sp. NBRC 111132 TaxID=1661047 RepID=UPI000761A153|nr:hypothetical protein [Pseudomonas sp. NBRC 111132]
MPFMVVITAPNVLNDPDQFKEYASEEEADAFARNLVEANPLAVAVTVQTLKRYRAAVTVNAEAS